MNYLALCRYFGLLLLIFSSHALAFIADDKLISNFNKFDFNLKEDEEIFKLLPHFGPLDNINDHLYENERVEIGTGMYANVYKAKSLIDRPVVGIKKGQYLAIRETIMGNDKVDDENIRTLHNFFRAAVLRSPERPLTEFFPAFYGAYTKSMARKMVIDKKMYFEMELIDETLDAETQYSDCFVFEFCLGEWAGKYFSKIGMNDNGKHDNYGVKKVDYRRTYEINGKKYIIEPGNVPMRIDVGGAGFWKSTAAPITEHNKCSLKDLNVKISSSAKLFLEDLINIDKKISVLKVFDNFYNNSCKSEQHDHHTNEPVETKVFQWPKIEETSY